MRPAVISVSDGIIWNDWNRGVIRFYDLIPASFKFSGGTGEELEKMRDRWPRETFWWGGSEWRLAA